VSSRVILHPGTGVLQAVRAVESFVPAREAVVVEFPHAESHDQAPHAEGCIRGVQYALAIEAGAALFLYCLWQVLHLFR